VFPEPDPRSPIGGGFWHGCRIQAQQKTGITIGHAPRSWASKVTTLFSRFAPAGAGQPKRARKSGCAGAGGGSGTSRATTLRRMVNATGSPSAIQAITRGKFCLRSLTDAVFIAAPDVSPMPTPVKPGHQVSAVARGRFKAVPPVMAGCLGHEPHRQRAAMGSARRGALRGPSAGTGYAARKPVPRYFGPLCLRAAGRFGWNRLEIRCPQAYPAA
jgi:hypothetical protein